MIKIRSRKKRVLLLILLFVMTIPYVLPLIQTFLGSLGGRGFQNYRAVWATGVVPLYFRNSILISLMVILLVLLLSMTAGFAFAKLKIRKKEAYFWLILSALTLPEVILLTPLFVTFQKLHLYNTYFAVVLPLAALQLPFSVLLSRNFMTGVPDEIIEAAKIDGANSRAVFRHVILPLSKPIASAIVMLSLINAWNSYLLPLIFLQDPALQTVTLLPQFFQGEYANDQTKILAAAVMTALPEILIYLLLQKNFEAGITAGAIK